MNCQEVEGIITDLARGVDTSELALAHLKECRRCGERMAEEERLTAGLLALAQTSAGEEAPSIVEERLLHAFRPPVVRTKSPHRWLPLAIGGSIAAAALLFRLFTTANPVAPAVATRPEPPAVASVAPAEIAPGPVAPRKMTMRRARRLAQPVHDPAPAHAEAQFLPVTQGDAWTPFDGGRLVRVKLPRSALRVFGLPMDEERAQEPVQADVMLSNDGLLRAIRFVR